MLPDDSAAAAADAAVAARHAGADRIRPIKMGFDFDHGSRSIGAKRGRNSEGGGAVDGDGALSGRRKGRAAPWSREEWEALRSRMLRVGHELAPELEEDEEEERHLSAPLVCAGNPFYIPLSQQSTHGNPALSAGSHPI